MPNPFDTTKHEEEREERQSDAMERYLEMLLPERIVLSAADFNAFADALENPPEPNERLKALFRNHK